MKNYKTAISRRDFIRAGLAAGSVAMLGRPSRVLAANTEDEKLRRTVSLIRGTDSERMVRKAFESLGGAKRFISTGSKVVVKPNASFANAADWGNNTNPAVLQAVCKVCREAGARRVTVVDYPLFKGAEALDMNGTTQALSKLQGVDLQVLSKKHQFRSVIPKQGVVLKEVAIARSVLDADLVINLPVAKAHDAVAASIGLKNLMGIIWDRAIFHTGMEINQGIADLAVVVRPGLTIVDMTKIMVTNGPKGPGEVVTPELLVAGVDPVATDCVALRQVRFNGRKFRPKQIKYLSQAHKAGLGELDLGKLDILKEDA